MLHPSVTADLARLHIADLQAGVEQARAVRRSTGSRPRASLWRRRRPGRASPPVLVLLRSRPAEVPAPREEDVEAA